MISLRRKGKTDTQTQTQTQKEREREKERDLECDLISPHAAFPFVDGALTPNVLPQTGKISHPAQTYTESEPEAGAEAQAEAEAEAQAEAEAEADRAGLACCCEKHRARGHPPPLVSPAFCHRRDRCRHPY
jgi:hypothetical protein